MNTKTLYCALLSNPVTRKNFDGIFARDMLMDIHAPPRLIVCNTDKSYQSGKHWILFHFIDDHVRFFDSLGYNYDHYGSEFVSFVNKWANSYEYCSKRIQPQESNLCGFYCLYFAFFSSQGKPMKDIVQNMSSLGSSVVLNFVKRFFYLCKNVSQCFVQCCIRQ